MTLAISDTKGANEIYDGHQLKEIFSTWDKDIEKIFDPKLDCLIMDNHFTSETKEFITQKSSKGYSMKNLCLPIRKESGKKLTRVEREYKNAHGGLRSIIETEKFAFFCNKFQRFSNFNKIRTLNFYSFNIQLRNEEGEEKNKYLYYYY